MWKNSPPIDAGICPFCFEPFSEEPLSRRATKEHVIARAWYPTNSLNFPRPQVIACNACNGRYGEQERYLLSRLGFVFGFQNPHAVGLHDKAVRAMPPSAGDDERDALARSAERNRVGRSFTIAAPDDLGAINPQGFRPQELRTAAGLYVRGNLGLPLDPAILESVGVKIARGLFLWETESPLARDATVRTQLLSPSQYQSVIAALGTAFRSFTVRKLPPGVWYLFAPVEDDPWGSVSFTCLWERILFMGTTYDNSRLSPV